MYCRHIFETSLSLKQTNILKQPFSVIDAPTFCQNQPWKLSKVVSTWVRLMFLARLWELVLKTLLDGWIFCLGCARCWILSGFCGKLPNGLLCMPFSRSSQAKCQSVWNVVFSQRRFFFILKWQVTSVRDTVGYKKSPHPHHATPYHPNHNNLL